MPKRVSANLHHAFTLVELLVVIAIVSVLAGLLLPVIEDAIDAARQVTCLNNDKDMMLATFSYVNDNDGWTFCLDSYGFYGTANRTTKIKKLLAEDYLPYETISLEASPSLYCPVRHANWDNGLGTYAFRGYYYTFFKLGSGKIIANDANNGISTEALGHSKFVLWTDTCVWTGNCESSYFNPNGGYIMNARHSGLAAAGFADGHAAGIAPEVTWNIYSASYGGFTVPYGKSEEYGIALMYVGLGVHGVPHY